MWYGDPDRERASIKARAWMDEMDAVVDATTAAKTMRGVSGALDGPAQMPALAPEGSTSTSVPAT